MGFFGDILGGVGSIVESISDQLGLPEEIGDIASGVANALTQNWAGFALDVFDLVEGLDGEELLAISSDNYKSELTPDNGKAWADLRSSDRDAFEKEFEKLSQNEQREVMDSIQQHLQFENQKWSMMTAISQAQHDTQKAIISNFRV